MRRPGPEDNRLKNSLFRAPGSPRVVVWTWVERDETESKFKLPRDRDWPRVGVDVGGTAPSSEGGGGTGRRARVGARASLGTGGERSPVRAPVYEEARHFHLICSQYGHRVTHDSALDHIILITSYFAPCAGFRASS